MSMDHPLTNCPKCGAVLEFVYDTLYCPKCDKSVMYLTKPFSVDSAHMKAHITIELEDNGSIVIIPLDGTIRVLTGSTEKGIALVFDTKGEDNGENRTGSSPVGGSGTDS